MTDTVIIRRLVHEMKLARMAVVMATCALAACGSGTALPSAPSAPRAADASSPVPPAFDAEALQPTITRISPNVVSTAGTWGTITGTRFQPGATLKIGGAAVPFVFRDSTTIQFPNSGAHAPGAVDVIVTNPGGLAVTVVRGYTYAFVASFDVNGDWIGHADAHNHYETDMRFTIRDNILVGLSCGSPVTMPTTLSAKDGAFSFAGDNGLALSGTLVSVTTAAGEVNAPGCGDGRWWADKLAPEQF